MADHDTAYWLERLSAFDVPNAPILSIGEALDQEHVASRGLIETVKHPVIGDLRVVRGPIRFDGDGPAPASPPSLLGEDNHAVLSGILGLPEAQIEQLRRKYSAAIRMRRRIASLEMFPDCWPLPHLICSQHLWVRSKSDEADQRDDEEGIGCCSGKALCRRKAGGKIADSRSVRFD